MANIFTRIANSFKSEKRSITVGPTDALGLPYGFSTSPISLQLAMQLSAVYRCVEVISDAIASQTWEYLNFTDSDGWVSDPFNTVSYMLNNEPHPAMSRFTIMKTLVAKVLLEGNGYLIIRRDVYLNPIRLDLVTGNVIEYLRKDGTIYYEVQYAGYDINSVTSTGIEMVEGVDMIHILNFTYDGFQGVSTLRHAVDTMGLAYASESSAKGFFTSGANMSGILEVEGKLTPEKAKAIKDAWAKAFNITSGQPGGIAVMESGLKFNPVTVNPKDAQMLETRKFNVVEICRFFGVSPSKVFDSENLTYSNIESFQLGFLTDTISPLDSKIEAEFNRKLLRKSLRPKTRLNLKIDDLLRANMDSTANYISKMFQVGGYTVNEVRAKAGNPKVEGGDKAYVPMSLIATDAPVTQNKKVDKNLKIQGDGNGD
jgi:HK97 family phage portal protein